MAGDRPGRKPMLTQELADELCARLLDRKPDGSPRSLRHVCSDADMPTENTVMRWVIENPDFAKQYMRAKAAQALMYSEEIIELADDRSIEFQHKRIMVDTRKWYLGKVLPKIYGDRVSLELQDERGSGTNPDVFRYVVSRMAATGETLAQALEYAYKHPQEVRGWITGETVEVDSIEEGDYEIRDEGEDGARERDDASTD